ncbi:tripartite motif-containing protein 3-like [Ylistrum balloti]|uniref:tripartite motif-containing protein 3-like n=1 Tax=Ylistrum balloti TaxID=509963 RepID=UPI00290596DE|nr:tripartite motif-containing protein 3-like [Ylistrum balloti]
MATKFRSYSVPALERPNTIPGKEINSKWEGSVKTRFSSALDRIFKRKCSICYPLSGINTEIAKIDEGAGGEVCTDDSSESDSILDSEEMSLWNFAEGQTDLQFAFDNQLYLDNLEPEVILKFSCIKKTRCLSDASDVLYIGSGKSVVVDMAGNRVLQFNKRGKSSFTYKTGHMVEPWAVAVNSEDIIHVTSRKGRCITRFYQNREIKKPIKNIHFNAPSGIAFGKDDQFFVTDVGSNLLTAHEPDGALISTIGNSRSPTQDLVRPRYVTVAPNNNIIVCDSGNHSLKAFDSEGNFVQKIGERGKGEGQLKCPYGVCTDFSGNIIVADHYNNRVSFFSKSGQYIRQLVTSVDGVTLPQGVCLTSNHRLLVTHGGLKANEVLLYDLRNNQLDNTSPDRIFLV